MQQGYIKIYRQLLENPIASNGALLGFFVVLLLRCNHKKDNTFYLGNTRIVQQPGEAIISQKELSRYFGVGISTINRWLHVLADEGIVETKGTNKYTSIKVVKRDKYQGNGNQTETKRKPNGNLAETINNDKNEKEGKEKEFDLLWDLWSSKLREYNTATNNDRSQGGKTKAKEKYMKLGIPIVQVENAINGYFQERIHTKEYPKHMVTWLNQGGYNDEYEIVNREKSDEERIKEYAKLGYTKFKETYGDDEYRRVRELRANQSFKSLSL